MQAKFMMGLIAQKEDDAEREEQQMQFLALSKGVEATQKLLDSKILIAEKTLSPAGTSIWGKISELLKRLILFCLNWRSLGIPMIKMSNPIVAQVLEQASAFIGVDTLATEYQRQTEDDYEALS